MTIAIATHLACPLDRLRLEHREGQLVCPQGHSYDISSRGYVNLLPVQFKRSLQPGDGKEMIAARQRFLENGAYAPISRRLTEWILAQAPSGGSVKVVDAGCGEGYYLSQTAADPRVAGADHAYSFLGMDISKPAIIAAAKRTRAVLWAVGTNRHMPVVPGTADLVSCVFCPYQLVDFAELLVSTGKVVLVEAGAEHLIELRRALYPKLDPPSDHAEFSASARRAGLRVVDRQNLCFRLAPLEGPALRDLLMMTPHYFRASPEVREPVLAGKLELTVDVVFTVLDRL